MEIADPVALDISLILFYFFRSRWMIMDIGNFAQQDASGYIW